MSSMSTRLPIADRPSSVSGAPDLPARRQMLAARIHERGDVDGLVVDRIEIGVEVAGVLSRDAAFREVGDQRRDVAGEITVAGRGRRTGGYRKRDGSPVEQRARAAAGGGVEAFAGEDEFHGT